MLSTIEDCKDQSNSQRKCMNSLATGFFTGGGLIIAIGAQNAFVLEQGIKKQHRFIVPFICSFCDVCLIFIGLVGMGELIETYPQFRYYSAVGGTLFLSWYGLKTLFSALKPNKIVLVTGDGGLNGKVITTTLALTLLNPHVYLDTIVFMGAIGGQYGNTGKYLFGVGASAASILWFYSLSFSGTLLAPLFKKQHTWRILDSIIALTMFYIGWNIFAMRNSV